MKSILFLAAIAPILANALPPTFNGKCGKAAGTTCQGFFLGSCCGADNTCGLTAAQCGTGCQSAYGICKPVSSSSSSAFSSKYSSSSSVPVSSVHVSSTKSSSAGFVIPSGFPGGFPSGFPGGFPFTSSSVKAGTTTGVKVSSKAASASSSAKVSSVASSSAVKVSSVASSSSAKLSSVSSSSAKASSVSSSSVKVSSVASSSSAKVSSVSSSSAKVSSIASVSSTKAANATSSVSSTLTSSFISSSSVASSSSTLSSSTSSTCATAPTYTAGRIPGCTPCQGQPGNNPKTWCGYDINTNYYENTPKTCRVVTYNFDITETTASPDGVSRMMMLVNGQFPGPTIHASWGDTVVVNVNNKLVENGTSIHFHGVRQLNNNMNDGVPSITQCPVAPGSSMTYTWVAEAYGTSWYHSHYAIQAWEGVNGPMIIDGPSSSAYDGDLGTFMISDWSHFTVDSRYDQAENANVDASGATIGGPVTMDNGLINGKNIWLGDNQNSTAVGSRYTAPTSMTSGKKYLLRFINSAIQSTYKVQLDGHSFTVISTDFVPITPYTTTVLSISIGQRYEVIVEADQPSGSYWLRADNQNSCATTVQALDIKAIINYSGSSVTPTSTASNYTAECVDEPLASLVPVVALNAGPADFTEGTLDVVVAANSANLFKWYLSGTTFASDYDNPTLLDVYQNTTLPTYSGNLLVELPNNQTMVYVIVESPIPLPHPLHLHGHDFWILASGTGTYDSSVVLNLANPPRRDTALLPTAGYIVLAFVTDNPGAWLMHCHIGWHTSMGFALQFLEMQDKIQSSGALNNSCALKDTCSSWNTWATANNALTMEDSGV